MNVKTVVVNIVVILVLLVCLSMQDYVPVYMMMPLKLIESNGQFNNNEKLNQQLRTLQQVGVDGVMVDVWWGIVQRGGPFTYDWSAYRQFFQLCKDIGLKVQANLAFHQCGTNVGDECYVPLPDWVLAVGQRNPDIFYTDSQGHRDQEYLSLGVDLQPLFPGGRTAVQLYADFMSNFSVAFNDWIGGNNLINSIEIGLGPAGELRYPSYQLQNNIWTFPGVGEFQCYDRYMLASLNSSAYAAGHPEWSHGGPDNAGTYNSYPPTSIPFYSDQGFDNFNSPYGHFFLTWYSTALINHGDLILSQANRIFVTNFASSDKPHLAAKIAGIHWWYMTFSHPAELTAGYYDTYFHDGYIDIASMFKKYNVEFAFTCMEMTDASQQGCGCGPEQLVDLTRQAAVDSGIRYSGENALPIFNNPQAYKQIVFQAKRNGKTLDSFTYLRMADDLFSSYALSLFSNLVNILHNL